VNRVVLLLAILAIVLAGNGLAIAQTEENTSPSEAPSQSPTAAEDDRSTFPCGVSLFREEQQQLVQFGYPTPVSQRARDCEELGYVNPYPAPATVGSDGFVYPYDPIEGQYLYLDPTTGRYYVLDPNTGNVSAYDPASGTYLQP
jgi:hypothetical protein